MKVIIYTRPDGGVSIVNPAPAARVEKETEDQFIARIQERAVPADATNVRVVEQSTIPSDRTFRNAWKSDLTVDMPKARGIHRDRLRAMRAPKMQALDAEYLRADERGDLSEKRRIATFKQALRDAPADPAIEAARTPEDLKAIIPAALG